MSDFLFARASFWEGIARLIDFGGTLDEYNKALTPEQADRIALEQDWIAVGKDLQWAMDEFEVELEDAPPRR